MPSLAGLQEQRSALEPVTKPLDDAAWQAWLAKNRAQEQRRNAAPTYRLMSTMMAFLM